MLVIAAAHRARRLLAPHNCGDDPDLDYREVSPELRRIRGPYPMAAGVTAYVRHAEQHFGPVDSHQSGSRPSRESTR